MENEHIANTVNTSDRQSFKVANTDLWYWVDASAPQSCSNHIKHGLSGFDDYHQSLSNIMVIDHFSH